MKRLSPTAVIALVALALVAAAAVAPGAGASDQKARARAERATREGEYEAAEKIYRDLVAKDPRDSAARLGLSRALLKQRKHLEAYDHAARVIAREPESARAHALLGAALLGSGDFRLSVEEFRTALSFKDDEAIAIGGLAMVDFYESRISQSLAGLRRAAFIDPNEPDYIFNLGQVAARNERYREAADAYETFLRVAPKTDSDRRARIRGLIDFLRYLGQQGNLLAVGGPDSVTLPFELVNSRPVVHVRVNGSQKALRFVVDTGAGMCVISDEAAERVGLSRWRAAAWRAPSRRGAASRSSTASCNRSTSARRGRARARLHPPLLHEQEPVDGYIGLSVLGKYTTVVDYGGRQMLLLREEGARRAAAKPAPPGAIEVPIRTTSSGFWSGEVSFDGLEKPANFIIDTGASISVVSKALAARAGFERFALAGYIKVYGAAGLADNIQTVLLPRFTLAAHTWQNIYAAVLDMEAINETAGFEQTGIVGGNILRRYRVTFDFARGVIRLDPDRASRRRKTSGASRPSSRGVMKQSIYLETSVVGAYLDNGEPFRRDLTIRWWEHEMSEYRPVVSPLVVRELERVPEPHSKAYLKLVAPLEQVELTDEVAILAEGYIARGIFHRKYIGDALHVALASLPK